MDLCCGGFSKVKCGPSDAGQSFCKVSSDWKPTTKLANSATSCSALSSWMLSKISGNKQSWSDVTCSEIAATTWQDTNKDGTKKTTKLKELLIVHGAPCCGVVSKVKCNPSDADLSLCKVSSDWKPTTKTVDGMSCSTGSSWLLSKTAGNKQSWSDVTCSEIAATTWQDTKDDGTKKTEKLKDILVNPNVTLCCAGVSNVRCFSGVTITQDVKMTAYANAAAVTSVVKEFLTHSYAAGIGIYDAVAATYETGCTASSTIKDARRAGIVASFSATVSAAKATAAKEKSNDMAADSTLLVTAMNAVKAGTAKYNAITVPTKAQVTVSAPTVTSHIVSEAPGTTSTSIVMLIALMAGLYAAH